ncbi:hypothetical protein Arub01_46930 [Actinomadura rubrobrunea]|uniref:Uncharacterized protein n=1 Tax=Actinomadura rubrobrunea TaxID=115335 RepID=A0A9W6PXX8_9ACTN|nr:hypothetical protein [Actinomadura rubrobrunea]GLW66449.1 hypothetical protein Arub01_46930 [Actinomadura rubrobrunea]
MAVAARDFEADHTSRAAFSAAAPPRNVPTAESDFSDVLFSDVLYGCD